MSQVDCCYIHIVRIPKLIGGHLGFQDSGHTGQTNYVLFYYYTTSITLTLEYGHQHDVSIYLYRKLAENGGHLGFQDGRQTYIIFDATIGLLVP